MFDGFRRPVDRARKRRVALSIGASLLFCSALAAGMMVAAGRTPPEKRREKALAVVFRPPPPKPRKPPPPPAVPPTLRVKKVAVAPPASVPPPPPPLVEQVKIPERKHAEADPSKSPFVAIGDARPSGIAGSGGGEAAGPPEAKAPPSPPPPPPPPRKPDAVNLPEDAEPPEPSDDNEMPEYPEEMREKGIEGQVIFKVIITENGDVKDLQVLRGEEPFLSIARSVVIHWKFTPAKLEGQAIAVYKIIKIPFRLK